MSQRFTERLPFARIIIICAIAFGVSLGLCGITAMVSGAMRGGGSLVFFGLVELGAIILSGIGLLLTTGLWVLASILDALRRRPEPEISQAEKHLDDAIDHDPDPH